MELFDVLDKNQNPLGYTKIRGEELNENEYNNGTDIWIFNNKKLLMTKRSINKSHAGEWEVPGGCSKAGETSVEALVREIKEEIGVDIKKEDCIFLGTDLYKKNFVDVYKSNLLVDLSKVKLQEEEVSDIKFVSKKEFLDMVKAKEVVESIYNRYEFFKDKIKEDW